MEQKNFKTKYEERMFYQSMLHELIPNLEQFSFLRGTEGKAYFIDDDFVVKKFYSDEPVEHFEKFFEEMNDFAKQGISVAKFYAWEKVNYSTDSDENCYYILEERAKGKQLFNEYREIYSRVSNKFSYKEFRHAIAYPDKYPEIYTEIMYEYINDVNQSLGNILSVPEKEIDKFLVSMFNLYNKAKVSSPDIHPGNIYCDGKTMTIIDEYMRESRVVEDESENKSKETIMEKFLEDIFHMFDVLYVFAYMKEFDVELKDKVSRAKEDVLKRAFGVIKTFVKKSQKLLNYEDGWNYYDYLYEAEDILGEKLGKELAKELIKGMERE